MHQLTAPPLTHGTVSVTNDEVIVAWFSADAQWASRFKRSRPSRASCCDWNRLFMSASAFVPWTKSAISAVMTVPKMTSTVSISTSV